MLLTDFITRLVIALAAGLVIGIERHASKSSWFKN
jgi:uncharacterized membrane protein YhiD involved in acid resistance